MKFPHRILEGEEERAVIESVIARIPHLNKAGTKERWEKGWGQILAAYKKSGDIADLRPQYIRPNQPVRLGGKFVMPQDPDIEAKWYEWFFAQIVQKWLAPHHGIWEFGCGSGWNVATLARAYPDKVIYGCDWSDAAMDICGELRNRYSNLYSMQVDFFNPPMDKIEQADGADAAVFTVGALEQTGHNWKPFLEYLLAVNPAICVHIEPVCEWYDIENPVDRTAIMAHKARGFWQGFPDELKRRAEKGELEILHMERTGFGSLFCEGYSQIIWRPL